MWRWQARVQKWLLPAALLLLLLYTADQLLTGERGIVTWRVMKTQVEALRKENEALHKYNSGLEKRISYLKPKAGADGRVVDWRRLPPGVRLDRVGMDADFVDELVRRDLGYIKPGEQIILIER